MSVPLRVKNVKLNLPAARRLRSFLVILTSTVVVPCDPNGLSFFNSGCKASFIDFAFLSTSAWSEKSTGASGMAMETSTVSFFNGEFDLTAF